MRVLLTLAMVSDGLSVLVLLTLRDVLALRTDTGLVASCTVDALCFVKYSFWIADDPRFAWKEVASLYVMPKYCD